MPDYYQNVVNTDKSPYDRYSMPELDFIPAPLLEVPPEFIASSTEDNVEPEPDYDVDVPVFYNNRATSNGYDADVNIPLAPAPTSPKADSSLRVASTSIFADAIKRAALDRDQRVKDPAPANAKRPSPKTSPAPVPVPPPIPSAGIPQVSKQTTTDAASKPIPPQVQKQLDDTKKNVDSHAALMAAVLKRRSVLENIDETEVINSIESKVQRTKKLQIVYRADNTKTELKSPVISSPTGLLGPSAQNGSETKANGESLMSFLLVVGSILDFVKYF